MKRTPKEPNIWCQMTAIVIWGAYREIEDVLEIILGRSVPNLIHIYWYSKTISWECIKPFGIVFFAKVRKLKSWLLAHQNDCPWNSRTIASSKQSCNFCFYAKDCAPDFSSKRFRHTSLQKRVLPFYKRIKSVVRYKPYQGDLHGPHEFQTLFLLTTKCGWLQTHFGKSRVYFNSCP